jgi:putative lipoprotein
LGVLLLSGCDTGGASITGDVTYVQRIALPEDAVVTVQLQDVSLMDVAAQVLGEQVIETDGDQVPISYEVEYDEDEIIDNHTCSVSARITDGQGNLLFISDTANPVITNGNPTSDVEIVTVPVGGG